MFKALLVVFHFAMAACAAAQPTQVFVVRHTERAAEPKDDPAISPEGVARAELLADLLRAANVGTIITSQYRRTQETAAPLAKKAGITPTVISIRRGELAAHVAEVAAQVRKTAGVVLVVGHSNTVADIVAALSSSKPVELCETSFSNLFVVTSVHAQIPALQIKYGKSDPAPALDCQ